MGAMFLDITLKNVSGNVTLKSFLDVSFSRCHPERRTLNNFLGVILSEAKDPTAASSATEANRIFYHREFTTMTPQENSLNRSI
jgi:hypothetical protein